MQLLLTRREHLGDNIWRFSFNAPTEIVWAAGQFIRIDLPHPQPDQSGTSRFFTISAAPMRRHPQITTRLTESSFKQALASLPIGGQLTLLDMAAGDFVWPDKLANPVFVARGIGITPFYAMLQDRENRGLPMSAVLVHSSRPGAFVPYQKELQALAHLHPELAYIPTEDTPTSAGLLATVPDLTSRTIFVSGPHKLLDLLSSPYNLPAKRLKTDYFPGYSSTAY